MCVCVCVCVYVCILNLLLTFGSHRQWHMLGRLDGTQCSQNTDELRLYIYIYIYIYIYGGVREFGLRRNYRY